jgi:hypothetical protein
MVETKELFNRLKRELDNRRKEREQEEEEKMMTITDENETSSTSSSVDTSSHIDKPKPHPPATGKKKRRHSSLTASLTIIEPSPLSLSLYSSMNLPTACLNEYDGCDDGELLARAKRCEEIMKLSQQAKEAEAARIKAANIKPLVWAKPTFEIDSTTSDTTDEAAPDDVETKAPGP